MTGLFDTKQKNQQPGTFNPIALLPIPKSSIKWLALSLVVAIGWHAPRTPIWATIASFIMGSIAFSLLIKEKSLPPMTVKLVLAGACVIGIILQYQSFLGRDQGIMTLILFSSLKMMELQTRRDFMILVFLCYFLVFGNFLFEQSLIDLVFTLLAAILITATLIRLNTPQPETGKVKISYVMKFTLRIFLYTLPFTLLLFFLFPRSTSPLWNFKQKELGLGQSGFNDVMQPGNFSELAQSTLPAFQVEFPNHDMPPQRYLYFRGAILLFTDGQKFYSGNPSSQFAREEPMTGPGILQNIIIVPHNQRWLFALDCPVVFPPFSQVSFGNIFRSFAPIRSYFQYTVLSRPDYTEKTELTQSMKVITLRYPRYLTKIMELGQEWRSQSSSDTEIVKMAENYFKSSGFIYTLRPGLMDERNPFEDFLFIHRRGFCEHYAGGFALLMRAAGIPARVVIGYQGGQYNSVGGYLQVRQADAHAWTEVWLQDQGWIRVDPTAWVSPERVEYSLEVSESLLSMGMLPGSNKEGAIQNALNESIFEKIWKFIKFNWDNINYKWDVWIMSYDRFKQRDFLKSLGFGNVKRTELFLTVIIIVLLFFFIFSYFLKRHAMRTDPLLGRYFEFCSRLEKRGIKRMRWEGPVHFEQRAVLALPKKANEIKLFTGLFVKLRYGGEPITKTRLKELKRLSRKL